MNGEHELADRRRQRPLPGRRPRDPLNGGLRNLFRPVIDAPLPADIAALLRRIETPDKSHSRPA